MTHLWVRAEPRQDEARVGLTPQGAASLIARGFRVTVEDSPRRAIPLSDFAAAGCDTAAEGAWPAAPADAIIFGLKELPEDDTPLSHRHIMFGHAYKGQPAGARLLQRFAAGGGTLYDLEYLLDEQGRRVAAFGTWAGFAGAAVALSCWIAQQSGGVAGTVAPAASAAHLIADLQARMVQGGTARPTALIIGAKGRVGTGAHKLN